MKKRFGLIIIAVLLVSLLVACEDRKNTEAPTATGAPTATTAPTATPTPTVTPTPMPKIVKTLQETVNDEDGNAKYIMVRGYAEGDILISEKQFDKTGDKLISIKTYDLNGKLVGEEHEGANRWEVWEYYDNGLAKNFESYTLKGEFNFAQTYEYNDNNRVIKLKEYTEDGLLSCWVDTVYDENDNIIKETGYYGDGTLMRLREWCHEPNGDYSSIYMQYFEDGILDVAVSEKTEKTMENTKE